MPLNPTRTRRLTTALMVVLLSLAVPVAGETRSAVAAGIPDVSSIRIDNFGRVTDRFFRGAQPEGNDYRALAAAGVKTVINLTSDDVKGDEQARVEEAGMAYVHIPMTTHDRPTSAQTGEFLRLVNDAIRQPIYVHCVGGRHRTGVMTALYRMTQEGWTADQAYREMKEYGFGADFLHPEFKAFVYSYRPDTAPPTRSAAFVTTTNLTDLKSANTLDTLDTSNGRAVIRHYLQDVGSTFGLCNDLHEWDLSWEHFFQADTTRKRLFSLGFALSPWQTVDYGPEYPSIGKFEGDRFDPRAWRPQTPTTAYMEARDDDAFWAARRIVAFTDDLIRAVVHVGEFSNAAAEKYLGDVLIKRRNKIAGVYMTAVNPIVSPRLDGNGRLTFDNAAVAAGVAKAPTAYHASWTRYDNATDQAQPLFSAQSATTAIDAPGSLPTAPASMIAVDISADSDYPAWKRPIRTFFRRVGNEWKLVGLERLPESAAANTAARSPKR